MPAALINEFTELGKWHMGPGAPNGSVFGRMQRYCSRIEIIEREGRFYQRRWPMFQSDCQSAPSFYPGGSEKYIGTHYPA